MARPFKPKVITANDLLAGHVVYFTRSETWSRTMQTAAIARTPIDAEDLLATAAQQQNIVVDPVLADVELNAEEQPAPAHFRERFRANGPSLSPAIWNPRQDAMNDATAARNKDH